MNDEEKIDQLKRAQKYFTAGRIVRDEWGMWKALERVSTGLSILAEVEAGDILYTDDRGTYILIHTIPEKCEDMHVGVESCAADGVVIDEFVMESDDAPDRIKYFSKVTIDHGDAMEAIAEIHKHIEKIMKSIFTCRGDSAQAKESVRKARGENE